MLNIEIVTPYGVNARFVRNKTHKDIKVMIDGKENNPQPYFCSSDLTGMKKGLD